MKHLLNKDTLIKICESYKLIVGDYIFIHHPITNDLVNVIIKELKRDQVLVTIPPESLYLGQPDWFVKKINIIGKGVKQN